MPTHRHSKLAKSFTAEGKLADTPLIGLGLDYPSSKVLPDHIRKTENCMGSQVEDTDEDLEALGAKAWWTLMK